MSSRILVVEHDEAMVEALEHALRREGLETVSAIDGASALQSFHHARPDAVLLAVELGDESGIEVCQALRDAPRGQLVPILYMGALRDGAPIQTPGEALAHGGDYFFPLPNDLEYLAGRVRGWTSAPTLIQLPKSAATEPDALLELSDFIEFTQGNEQESITEHDYSPIPPILRVKSKSDPSDDDASLSLVYQAEALRAAGLIKDAVEIYAAAAAMYETDGETGPALAIYKLILALDPGEYETARHAGQLAARVGRTKDALEIYRRTADSLEARGQLENATFLIHEMIRLRPDDTALVRRLQELELALAPVPESADRTFDELIAQEIGRSLKAHTMDLVILDPEGEEHEATMPDDDDVLAQDTLHEDQVIPANVVELPRTKVVRGLVSDLAVPQQPLPRAETPAEDWSDVMPPDPEETEELDETVKRPPARPELEILEEDERTPAWGLEFHDATEHLPVPEPVDAAPVAPAAFEVAPLTMGGWSRLPVWKGWGEYGEASQIRPARFVPVEGMATSLLEVVRLLSRVEEQRATGILEIPGAPRIVFVEGQPAALRGHGAVHAFLALLLNSGKLEEPAARELMADNQSERPVEVARLFVRQGMLREQEGTAFLHRHFEDGLTSLLRQHGGFDFDGSEEVEVVREEIVPEIEDVRRLLIELLPRVAGAEELLATIGGPSVRVRVSSLSEDGPSRDTRFLSLLDGRYELGEAARLTSMPPERAAAIAFVYVQFGLATIVHRPKARSGLGWIPLSQPTPSEPILSAPPKRVKRPKIQHPVDLHLDAPGRLRALADLVNANDYFTILGVTPDSDAAEVEEAHERLIQLIDLTAVAIDPDLTELARQVQRSLDEARDVLVNPDLRAAYQRHLKP